MFFSVLSIAVCLGWTAQARAFWTDGGQSGGAAEQLGLMLGTGADSLDPAAIPVAAPAQEKVLPPVESNAKDVKLSSDQMEKLLSLAQYADDNRLGGITKGLVITIHRFETRWRNSELYAINLTVRGVLSLNYERFTLYPDGTVDNKVLSAAANEVGEEVPMDKNMEALLMKEVAFWTDHETKRGRYPPNPKPEPSDYDYERPAAGYPPAGGYPQIPVWPGP